MPESVDDAFEAARAAATGQPEGLLQRIAERLGATASASALFGEPVRQDGVTVIPVAKVRWGFGGGGGSGMAMKRPAKGAEGEGDSSPRPEFGEGGGGGGGIQATPLGYIEIRDGAARFVRIPDPSALVPLILASAFAAWVAARAVRLLLLARAR
ncbi:MAG: spore germination protein GerW family protein [Dehalococcoidia bacterium]